MDTNWRNTRDYRVWRVNVIRRDTTCKVCGKGPRDGIVRHAHHMNHSAYFPDQRFDSENGVTLCSLCHSHFHNDYKGSTRKKCTKQDYKEYKRLKEYFVSISCGIISRELNKIKSDVSD